MFGASRQNWAAALHNENLAAIAVVDTRTGILQRLFAHFEQTPIIDIKKTALPLETAYNTPATIWVGKVGKNHA